MYVSNSVRHFYSYRQEPSAHNFGFYGISIVRGVSSNICKMFAFCGTGTAMDLTENTICWIVCNLCVEMRERERENYEEKDRARGSFSF